MDLSTLANLVNAIAVTTGLIFAAVQLRHYRQRHRRDAMLELVRSFQNASFATALRHVTSLPDGADRKKIRELFGSDGENAVFLVGLTWESIGLLVFRKEVTFDLVADFFRGPISISWRKLCVFVEEDRRFLERATAWEWFQWLAEQMIEREKLSPPTPAYIAHRPWR